MSTRTEWINANAVSVEYGEHEDADGNQSNGRALVLEGLGDVTVIEGTEEELLELANRIQFLLVRPTEPTGEQALDAIHAIHAILDEEGEEWDSSTIEEVAQVVLGLGLTIRDPNDVEG